MHDGRRVHRATESKLVLRMAEMEHESLLNSVDTGRAGTKYVLRRMRFTFVCQDVDRED